MTKIEFGPPYQAPVIHSADALMDNARKHPGLLITSFPWHFILPWLASPKAVISKFWNSYEGQDAEAGRKTALYGPKIPNRQNEQNLLGVVHEYQALSLQKFGFSLGRDEPLALLAETVISDEHRTALMTGLKERMVEWVLEAVGNDPEAPKRLHEILKSKKTTKSEYADEPSLIGKVFTAFVQEIAKNWKLPTKKVVRKKAGLGDGPNDFRKAARAFRVLGLQGLPEA